jgi:hypothetical protein
MSEPDRRQLVTDDASTVEDTETSLEIIDPESYTIAQATRDNIRAQPIRHLILAACTLFILTALDPGDVAFQLAYSTIFLLIACALTVYGGVARQSDLEDEAMVRGLEEEVRKRVPRENAHLAAASFKQQPTSALFGPVFNLYQVPILLGLIINIVPLSMIIWAGNITVIGYCTAMSIGFHTAMFAMLVGKERLFPREKLEREVIARERLRIIKQVEELESSKGGVTLAHDDDGDELAGSLTMSDQQGALSQVDPE